MVFIRFTTQKPKGCTPWGLCCTPWGLCCRPWGFCSMPWWLCCTPWGLCCRPRGFCSMPWGLCHRCCVLCCMPWALHAVNLNTDRVHFTFTDWSVTTWVPSILLYTRELCLELCPCVHRAILLHFVLKVTLICPRIIDSFSTPVSTIHSCRCTLQCQ